MNRKMVEWTWRFHAWKNYPLYHMTEWHTVIDHKSGVCVHINHTWSFLRHHPETFRFILPLKRVQIQNTGAQTPSTDFTTHEFCNIDMVIELLIWILSSVENLNASLIWGSLHRWLCYCEAAWRQSVGWTISVTVICVSYLHDCMSPARLWKNPTSRLSFR